MQQHAATTVTGFDTPHSVPITVRRGEHIGHAATM